MISKLIIPPKQIKNTSNSTVDHIDAKKSARIYVDNMDSEQKRKLKKMLINNIECCQSVAQVYNVPLNEFVKEVKKII